MKWKPPPEACEHCRADYSNGRSWSGDAPRCAFLSGAFKSDNWNCATMNRLRRIAEQGAARAWTEDQTCAVLPLDGSFIVLGWYKSRGCTESASLLSSESITPLLLGDAMECIKLNDEHAT